MNEGDCNFVQYGNAWDPVFSRHDKFTTYYHLEKESVNALGIFKNSYSIPTLEVVLELIKHDNTKTLLGTSFCD